MLNFNLTPEQLDLQKNVRQFALEELLPVAWYFDEKTSAWRCRMCGHIHHGEAPPEKCPYCFFPDTAFKKVWPRE
jgi:rubrerythrin